MILTRDLCNLEKHREIYAFIPKNAVKILDEKNWKRQTKENIGIPPVCSCNNICPKELESAVKDPHLERPFNSAT